jgi:peptidoglycan/xylan/chitin deacetylase (PgdA/CDA1 family)
LIAIVIVCVFSPCVLACNASEEKKIIVVFRYDDYSSGSQTDLEVRLINAFKKYHINCTFGVIPFVSAGDVHSFSPQDVIPLSPKKACILKNAVITGTLEVALHGYSHQNVREKGGYTEFLGLDYNSQVLRLEKGRDFLESILNTRINIFIPPWNSYDLNTLHALKKLGFRYITTVVTTDAVGCSQLKFLPVTCGFLQLREAVDSARRISEIHPIITVLFHEYDFYDVDKARGKFTFKEFNDLLYWLTSEEDIHVMSITQANKVVYDLSDRRFMLNCGVELPVYLLPPILRTLIPGPKWVYFTAESCPKIKMNRWMYISFFYFTILMASFALALLIKFIISPQSRFAIFILKYGSLVLLALCSIYTFHDLKLSYKGIMVITLLLGMCAGFWSFHLKLEKRDLCGPPTDWDGSGQHGRINVNGPE